MSYFVNSTYFLPDLNSELSPWGISIFNHYVASLDQIRNSRLNLARVSVTADLVKTNSTRPDMAFNSIREADLVLHYLTELAGSGPYSWFPRTSVYHRGGLHLFEKMVSKRSFEKLKALFGVESPEQLKGLVRLYVQRSKGIQRSYSWQYEVRPLEKIIPVEQLGTLA